MLLIVGLGNPGSKYQFTRHNVGFLLLDYLASTFNLAFTSKFKSLYLSTTFNNQKVILLKPQTFMNLSGDAVLAIMQFYKITPSDILVIHDDIYLDEGTLRYKFYSGDGGQNGIANIASKIGKGFHRLKVGIGKPENPNISSSDYVLSNLSQANLDGFVKDIGKHLVNNLDLLTIKNFKALVEKYPKK